MESTPVSQNIPRTVDARQLAALLDVDTATIYKRASANKIPSPVKLDGKMMWNTEGINIQEWKLAVAEPIRIPQIAKPPAPKPEVKRAPVEAKSPHGPTHKCYPTLLYFLSRRRHVYIYGPMGSGKSHAAQQAAEALGLDYAYVSLNPQSPASLLTGFIDAQGRYVRTKFRDCYENGGVFCIDELDNSSPSLLTTLNSALANGHSAFPDGMIERHANFVLVSTGNTTGRGGDWQYPERRKVDEATLDRLAFIAWEYDERLENSIVARISSDVRAMSLWVGFVRKVREYVNRRENGIKGGVYATPRSVFAGCDDVVNSSLTVEAIADATVFKGLDKDTKARILAMCPLPVIQREVVAA